MKKILTASQVQKFQQKIYHHYEEHGRQLPWRETTNPYFILVSEIMLQQTQVDRVLKKYPGFIAQFSTLQALAKAPVEVVLAAWHGLGYNRRALYLKRIAERTIEEFGGTLPSSADVLTTFPGLGKNTAASIAAFAFNQPVTFIETNIRTVFIHTFFPTESKISDENLLPLITRTLDTHNPRRWYNALMDYGTMLKNTLKNPSRASAHHRPQSRFVGSRRQLRGQILKTLLAQGACSLKKLSTLLQRTPNELLPLISTLEKEGFLTRSKQIVALQKE